MFGRPAPSTIDTPEHSGANVYRTDADGSETGARAGRIMPRTRTRARHPYVRKDNTVKESTLPHGKPVIIALVLVSMLVGSLLTGTVLAMQGNMVNARDALKSAITDLEAATPDKGGHRTNAIKLTRQAIQEVNLGIQYANEHRR